MGRQGPANIRFESVSKRYGTITAVDHLDLEINRGELFVLMGPSGSGKTTMLRMVNRLVDPDEGRILINGEDITLLDPVDLRRNIGYVIQHIGLFPHLTVSGNIGLVPTLAGMPGGLLQERIRDLLSLVRLSPLNFSWIAIPGNSPAASSSGLALPAHLPWILRCSLWMSHLVHSTRCFAISSSRSFWGYENAQQDHPFCDP